MNKNDIKYIFLCILMIILIIFLIYSAFKMFLTPFSTEYVIGVNNKNRQEINEMLKKEGIEDHNITRLEIKTLLGDAELRAYSHFILCDKKIVDESCEIMIYMWENGSSIGIKYMLYILATIILIAINKELIDKENEKFEAIRKEKMKE